MNSVSQKIIVFSILIYGISATAATGSHFVGRCMGFFGQNIAVNKPETWMRDYRITSAELKVDGAAQPIGPTQETEVITITVDPENLTIWCSALPNGMFTFAKPIATSAQSAAPISPQQYVNGWAETESTEAIDRNGVLDFTYTHKRQLNPQRIPRLTSKREMVAETLYVSLRANSDGTLTLFHQNEIENADGQKTLKKSLVARLKSAFVQPPPLIANSNYSGLPRGLPQILRTYTSPNTHFMELLRYGMKLNALPDDVIVTLHYDRPTDEIRGKFYAPNLTGFKHALEFRTPYMNSVRVERQHDVEVHITLMAKLNGQGQWDDKVIAIPIGAVQVLIAKNLQFDTQGFLVSGVRGLAGFTNNLSVPLVEAKHDP